MYILLSKEYETIISRVSFIEDHIPAMKLRVLSINDLLHSVRHSALSGDKIH